MKSYFNVTKQNDKWVHLYLTNEHDYWHYDSPKEVIVSRCKNSSHLPIAMAPIYILMLLLSVTGVLGEEILRRTSRSQTIDHYELFNVVYNLSQATQTVLPDSVTLAEKNVQNNSPYDATSTLSMKATHTTTSEWSEMSSVEIQEGFKITVSAGIPIKILQLDVDTEFEITKSTNHSYSYGESHTTSETTDQEVSVDLPAYSRVKVSMIANEANVNVPYTATLKTVYVDKRFDETNVSGVYKNVHQTSFESIIEELPFNNTAVGGAIKILPTWSKSFMLIFHVGILMLLVFEF